MRESVTYQLLVKEGRKEGRQETIEQIVLSMLKEDMAIEVITRITGLSVEQIQQIRAKQQ